MTQKNVGNIVDFPSSLVTPLMIQNKLVKGGASFDICAWVQKMEINLHMMKDVLDESYWSSQNLLVDKLPLSNLQVYNGHDAKLLYFLLQYSQWNCKNNPFLVCKYDKIADLDNENHKCEMMNDSEHKRGWKISRRRRDSKNARSDNYVKSHHSKDWCDESNCGVT